ncbi:MAG TPA: aminoglycoside phosphotransferase family protein [Chloroflexota bacterium]|nr:aminoglycoside phosphotransferase family protein [Chloroflexota bacterium]
MEFPGPTDPILTHLVREHVGADERQLHLTPITTGHHNTSYWVDAPQGRYVLRLAPPDDTGLLFYERRMMRQEPDLHALLRTRTTIPVPEIIAHDFRHALIGRDWLLMTALPGVPLSELPGLTRRQKADILRQVGSYLRQLHALTAAECLGVTAHGYLGAHHPMAPQPTWASAFCLMWNKLLDDVVSAGCYTPAEAQGFRDLFERHRECFERLVPARLLHMDVWSQNILVETAGTQGRVTGLIDFDRALWGDVEIEFAVLDYCGISEPPFWQGYGATRDESPSAQIRRQFYLLYEVQKYMPIAVWRGRDPAGAQRYKHQCLTLATALGRPR